jgi:hypothetical protein
VWGDGGDEIGRGEAMGRGTTALSSQEMVRDVPADSKTKIEFSFLRMARSQDRNFGVYDRQTRLDTFDSAPPPSIALFALRCFANTG